jgi:hypothetical protein
MRVGNARNLAPSSPNAASPAGPGIQVRRRAHREIAERRGTKPSRAPTRSHNLVTVTGRIGMFISSDPSLQGVSSLAFRTEP